MLPSTKSPTRLRLLIEAPAFFSFGVRKAAEISDWEVVHCSGPVTGRDCPILGGVSCPAVRAADVVVSSLGLDTEQNQNVLAGVKAMHPDVPVVVLAWRADLARHVDLLEGCEIVTFPWTMRKLRAAVAGIAAQTLRHAVGDGVGVTIR